MTGRSLFVLLRQSDNFSSFLPPASFGDLDGFSCLLCVIRWFLLSWRVRHLLGRQSFCIHDLYRVFFIVKSKK